MKHEHDGGIKALILSTLTILLTLIGIMVGDTAGLCAIRGGLLCIGIGLTFLD